jgi:hypothetical protein
VAVVVLGISALSGCGARAVNLPDLARVTPPVLASRPADPGDSPQLAALTVRDTTGLPPSQPSADGALLPPGLAALRAEVPAAHEFERISIYDDSVYFTYADPSVPGRAVSATYSTDDGLRVFEPQLSSDDTYPLDGVDPDVPARLVAGIERRFPTAHVTDVDLRRSLSYDFGLVWRLQVQDARGDLAVVFADLDGTVVAVDQ